MIILKYKIPKQHKVSTNEIYAGKHWRFRKKQADYWHLIVSEDVRQLEQIKEPVMLNFKFYFKSRMLDSSNTSFMGKMLEDGLVKNGLFIDDSPKYIESVKYKTVIIEPEERRKMEYDYVIIFIKVCGQENINVA